MRPDLLLPEPDPDPDLSQKSGRISRNHKIAGFFTGSGFLFFTEKDAQHEETTPPSSFFPDLGPAVNMYVGHRRG